VALYHEGLLLRRKGRFESAQETLEKLCLLGGEGDEAANALGMTMLRMTDKKPPPVASVDAEIVLRIGRAQCLVGQRKYDEARPDFDALVKERSDYPNIHYAYGLFLLEVRDLNAGIEQLKEEIRRNPGHVYARLRIAAAQYKNDSSAGIPYAQEVVKLRPDLPFAHYLLGLLLLDADQSAQAIPELELAERTYSQDAKLYFALGSAYARVGRKQDAARARAAFARLNARAQSSSSSATYKESHPGLGPNKDEATASPK
jgi:predicted Zn-dependent protease